VFAGRTISYPRNVDSDVQDQPGRPAGEADEVKGLRALFRRPQAETGPDDTDPGNGALNDTLPLKPIRASRPVSATRGATGNVSTVKGSTGEGSTVQGGAVKGGSGKVSTVKGGAVQGGGSPVSTVKGAAAGGGSTPVSTVKGARTSLLKAPVIVSRPIVSPRLRADPRLRVWIIRSILTAVVYLGFQIWRDWRYGLTAAVIYFAADMIFQSKNTAVVPASARVTSAQRYTRRRLKVLEPAGYLALNARSIPGTSSVIDHLVVGPGGIYSMDSERLDNRIPIRVTGGMLYHGKQSMEGRLDHAQEEAHRAAAVIGTQLGQRVRVRPVMVIYGPAIQWIIMRFKGVDVFDGSRVGTYFRRQSKATRRHHLDSSQIAMVYDAAARALPPLNGHPADR
jgi:hypothetical protein